MEIEAKFIVLDHQTFKQLVEVDELAGLRLGKAQVKLVHDRYLDTAQGAFLLAGYACRLRTVGEASIVTLKSFAAASRRPASTPGVEVRLTPAEAGRQRRSVAGQRGD